MAWIPSVGTRVKTEKFGWGVVTWVRGEKVGLALDSAMLEIAVHATAIEPQAGSPLRSEPVAISPRQVAAEKHSQPLATEAKKNRHTIEALRFGIVPSTDLENLTLGYSSLKKWASECLRGASQDVSAFAEIVGAFGTGKSHTMGVVRHVAREANFITAKVEVDGKGVSLSDPGRLLMHVMQSLEIPEKHTPTPLLDLHLMAMEKSKATADIDLAEFDRVHSNYMTIQSLQREKVLDRWGEAMEAILEGSDELTASDLQKQISADLWARGISTWGDECYVRPKRLISLTRADRGTDFIRTLCAYARLARLAGYEGLVITLDEFEVEWIGLSKSKRQDLMDVVFGFETYLCGELSVVEAPLVLFIATTAEDDANPVINYLRQTTSGFLHELKPLSSHDELRLGRKVGAAYRDAYSIARDDDEAIVKVVSESLNDSDIEGSGRIRAFIKRFVFELDARFGPPEYEQS